MPRLPDLGAVREYLEGQGWVDMEVYSAGSRSSLVLALDQDLTYHHSAALVFAEPSYFAGPLHWTSAADGGSVIRVLSSEERGSMPDAEAARAEGFLFEIRTDEGTAVLIGASGVTLDPGRVYYYPRENLQPGESLAYWVSG